MPTRIFKCTRYSASVESLPNLTESICIASRDSGSLLLLWKMIQQSWRERFICSTPGRRRAILSSLSCSGTTGPAFIKFCSSLFDWIAFLRWSSRRTLVNRVLQKRNLFADIAADAADRESNCAQKMVNMLSNYLGDLYSESGQIVQGSLSAVSKPNFASKYSFESSRRDLHNALLCTVL